MYRILSFFYTLTTKYHKENLRLPFTTVSQRIKHLEINLTKEMKDLYSETIRR